MEFISDTTGEAMPLPKAFLSEFTKLEKEADELQVTEAATGDWMTEALKKALVDPKAELTESPLILSIDSTSVFSLQDFSCLLGKAKSKKTFFATLAIGTFLKGEIDIIKAYKPAGKKRIVWCDSEQSRNHVTKAYRRALALSCDSEFHDIEVYDLRPYSPKERLQLIDTVLRDQNPKNDISFVVIDGIRDLVTDINDPVQATDITTWLMKVTAEKDLHICTVLHQNKGDNNARGHLGTEIINKAQTVLSVTKETDSISMVKAEFCRDREFKPFYFTIDEVSGLPQILQGYSGGGFTESGSGRSGGAYISDEKHRELMGRVFSIESEYGYGDLLTQVMLHYTDEGFKTGQLKGKGAIAKCTNLGIIKKDGKVGSKGKYIMTNPV